MNVQGVHKLLALKFHAYIYMMVLNPKDNIIIMQI